MPRSNWKGVISFGLVSIPIVLYPAENKAADVSFHQIDRRNNARIKYQRINVETGKEVPWEQITRGYEYDKETTIPVPDEVFKKVAGENARTIAIETFVNKEDLDLLTVNQSYYLVPDKGGEKGYVILREALKKINRIGIAKVIISTKEYLSAILPDGDALILCLLKYDAELRKPEEFNLPKKELSAYKINKKEMEMAEKLIKSMSSKWRPEKYTDEYQVAIHKWIRESVENMPHTKMKQRPHSTSRTINFVELLKKSLASDSKKRNSEKRNPKKVPHHKAGAKANKHKHITRH